MFYVGQKVVCIKGGNWRKAMGCGPSISAFPEKGCIYTVSGKEVEDSKLWLTLEEFPYYTHFLAKYFRPAVERKTDISIFKELLNNPHKEQETVE